MQVRLLGPVDAVVDGVQRPVPGSRRKAVLAVLGLHRGEVVSTDRLVEAVWGVAAPPTAASTARRHVSHLRQILGSKTVIRASPPGYFLDLGAEGTDITVAESLIRGAAGVVDLHSRADRLRAGLALWRGRPLADVAGAWLAEQASQLDLLWLQAARALLEARLALGEHTELLPELERLARDHQLDEQIHGQLMIAFYRAGRQADALATYRQLRHTLSADLGIDPSQPLRELEAAVLRQDPALDPPRPATPAPDAVTGANPAPRPVPAQLPSVVPAFTGRDRELAALDAALAGADPGPGPAPSGAPAPDTAGAVVIVALSGTAGVGKTALAVHWAHRIRHEFPDGQLYLSLRGYDPEQPVAPAEALARLLSGLGVAGQDIPPGLDERAARYRSEIAGRRVLVVLDNAASPDQVSPLLPGTGTSMVVVTSRDSLAGLVALHGARRLELDLLPARDAVVLLRRLVGRRVDTEPEAAARLAQQCAQLPLALRVAAELVATRPYLPLADLVAELADQQRRLDLLDAGGDPRAAVTAVFSWSYRHLPPAAARAFRLAGLHPGPDLDAYAAAALTDTTLDEARRLLAALARAHLSHPTAAGRYGMHDLLRAYARGLATELDPDDERRLALSRLFDYYLSAAAAAADGLHPAEAHRRPRIPPAATPVPSPADPAACRVWLDAELPALVSVAAHAAGHGRPGHAVRLSATLFRYLAGAHPTDAEAIHGHALHAAQLTGDTAGEAQARNDLGTVQARLGRHQLAAEHLRGALVLYRRVGDRAGQARALGNLGSIEHGLGRYGPAADQFRPALALFRQTGDRVGEAWALTSLGVVEGRLGRHGLAVDHFRPALALFRQAGDRVGEAWALVNLGFVEEQLGRYRQAGATHRQALGLYQQLGDRGGEAWALTGIGVVATRRDKPDQATADHGRALVRFRAVGDREGEAWALNGLGEAAQAAGHAATALRHHNAALTGARRTGDRDQQARAHAGIARADPAGARGHLRRALALYTELGTPEADQTRAQLAVLEKAVSAAADRSPSTAGRGRRAPG
ncbi:MAG: hypothetical protein V7637_2540 [Mycobacteriales bacterium]